jgi:hypothetical protein
MNQNNNKIEITFLVRGLILVGLLILSLAGCGIDQQGSVFSLAPCSVTQTPSGATINCTDGTYANITNGSQGPQGPQGPQGSQGATGNANIATVQFCQNYTSNSSYPEYGFCINGNLYATFWDGKNAWTALITPGYYMSTATNASCNFTVGPNCLITDN